MIAFFQYMFAWLSVTCIVAPPILIAIVNIVNGRRNKLARYRVNDTSYLIAIACASIAMAMGTLR